MNEAAYIQHALTFPEVLDRHPVDGAKFQSGRHRKALETLRALHGEGRGTPWELDAVMGKGYCDSLPELHEIPLGADLIVKAIQDQAARRDLAQALNDLREGWKDPTATTTRLVDEALGKLLALREEQEQIATFREVLQSSFARVEQIYEAGGIIGVSTGWAKLDEIIGGWEPEKLYFVSARPGAGKTSFGLQTAVMAAKEGKAVYISSQEMGKLQLGMRLISQEGRVSSEHLRSGRIEDADWPKMTRAAGELMALPGWVDTRTGVTFDQLRGSVLRCHSKQPVGLVLVDYVQMMRGTGENKVYELESIAYGLKALSKEIQAPVIALSQLSRAAEGDGQKKGPPTPPKLSQMRGSGGLEQAADVVIILWQPDIKDPTTVEVRIAKHRDGRTGKFPALFNRAFTLFE